MNFRNISDDDLELCLELYVISGICTKRFCALLDEKLRRNGF
jgi:hypothetical protein